MKRLLVIVSLFCCLGVWAAEVIPPAPAHYFNDYAKVVDPGMANQLNAELEEFERQTSSQLRVAIYPHMQSDSSIDDYTVRVARSWQIGQKDKNNGAILFVFINDHKMFIQVGYGLEGALTDVLCKRIVSDEIAPRFKQGDFTGGLAAGVTAMMQATKGEYHGTGKTENEKRRGQNGSVRGLPLLIIIIFAFILIARLNRRLRGGGGGGWFIGGGGWGSGGGGWGGGGGGGGFSSGGGGSFGGGGAGGSW